MIIYKKVIDISLFLENCRKLNAQIGFVPTMGALHNGHISLLEMSKKQNQLTVCSIFVNPTQFNDKADFEKYPTTIEADIAALESVGCDVLFLPSVEEIYPDKNSLAHYSLGSLETVLEGKYRPGHFQGVCQVVDRLLSIIRPSTIYLGQKDYQQCMVLQKLIQLKNYNTQLIVCPTLRENSGLAMSSRNMRLSDSGKVAAIAIYNSLLFIKENIARLPLIDLKNQVETALLQQGFSAVDYVEICDAASLETITDYTPTTSTVVLVAAFIEGVRLIDNMVIS